MRTLVEALQERTAEDPDALAFVHLDDGEEAESRLTRGALLTRARAIGAALRERHAAGTRLLLVFPSGLDFVSAFWGCLLAGLVPVPVHPPGNRRSRERLAGIARDADVPALLSTAAWIEKTARLGSLEEALGGLDRVAVDEVPDGAGAAFEVAAAEPEAPALIQYTSGSTREPRGVLLRHRNLFENVLMLRDLVEDGEAGSIGRESLVSWLPVHHDMGLIGGVVAPPALGGPSHLLPPLHFLQRPVRWLRALTRFGGTVSAAPNFAFELCLRKVRDEQLEGLDLSRWALCLDGAERVRADTLRRFAERFAPVGLRAEALCPTYGLAEATVFATGVGRRESFRTVMKDGIEHVSCGRPLRSQEVRVVDPEAGVSLEDGAVGEVWIRGENVAGEYWNRPEESAAVFGARLPDDPEPWARTGDLGFLDGGELFLAGRLKELIVIRGRNHYPPDIEDSVRAAHPLLEEGRCAAFGVEGAEGEELVVVQEVSRRMKEEDIPAVTAGVRESLSGGHGLALRELVLVLPGSLPTTSSGKVRRRLCRERYLAGDYPGGSPTRCRRSSR